MRSILAFIIFILLICFVFTVSFYLLDDLTLMKTLLLVFPIVILLSY